MVPSCIGFYYMFFNLPLAMWLSLVITDLGVSHWSWPPWRQIELYDLCQTQPYGWQAVISLVRAGGSCVPGQGRLTVSLVTSDLSRDSQSVGQGIGPVDLAWVQKHTRKKMELWQGGDLNHISQVCGYPSWHRYLGGSPTCIPGYDRTLEWAYQLICVPGYCRSPGRLVCCEV